MFSANINNEEFNLPAIVSQESLQAVAGEIGSSFVNDEQELILALEKIGLHDITHLMQTAATFLGRKIQGSKLSLSKATKLNHKKIAYDFLKESGIQKPVFDSPEQKQLVLDLYFKLGRVYIHNILIKELAESNPNLAHSVLNWLRGIVNEISVDQGVSPTIVMDKLLLNDIYIPPPPLNINQHLPSPVKPVSPTYIVRNLISLQEINDVAQKLENQRVIYNKEEFTQLVHSEGAQIQPLKVRNGSLEFMAYLFFRMFKPYDKNHPPLLKMSEGKGHWDFIQQNLLIGTNTCPNRIRKIGSETSKAPKCSVIVAQVDDILKPFYKKHFKNSPIL